MIYNELPVLDERQMRRFRKKYKKVRVYTTKKTGCWLWGHSLSNTGYGQFSVNNKLYMAHRISYSIDNGYVPVDKQIDHLCKIRKCVNPSHLEIVTPSENVRRSKVTKIANKFRL